MVKIIKKILKSSSGLTLTEVTIALTVFSIFISSFLISQGYNISSSSMIREELTLQRLCEQVINQITISPPKLKLELTLSPNTKSFEDDYSNYEYTIEYRELKLPDLYKLTSFEDGEEEDDEESGGGGVQEKVFKELKKYIEKAIWQVIVTVRNKETKFEYSLSTWLRNNDAKIKIKLQ